MVQLRSLLAIIGLVAFVGATPLSHNILKLASGSQADPAAPVINYRLPGDVVPKAYKIELTPNIVENDFTFVGESDISIDVKTAKMKTIVLHAKDLTISSAKFIVNGSTTLTATPSINTTTDFLTLTFGQELPVGEHQLKLEFKGTLNDNMKGFYRSSYEDADGKKIWLATTQFEPTYARYAFPCWDEPALKATFEISIKHHRKYHALSNMHFVSKVPDATNSTHVVTTFGKTPVMSPYLVAFVVSDFESLDNDYSTFNIWARKNAIKNGDFALEFGELELRDLEVFTNITHKEHGFEKMDSIAIPDFAAGAMENWGLVTFRESALLVEENVTTTAAKQSVATVISHEFAHQWFGNLVSPLWWKYTWLNEGFAEYFQWFTTNKIFPDWRLLEQQVIKSLQASAFVVDSLQNSHPMNHDVNSPTEVKAIFDSISYQKAGSVIRMIRHVLGEENFQTALQKYLVAMKNKAATSDDLFKEFNAVSNSVVNQTGINFGNVLDNWANTPGFPVITVTRNDTTGKATISQERFLSKGNDTGDLYYVPINFATQEKKDFEDTTATHWLKNETGTSEIDGKFKKGEWVIFNKQHFGYYRVNYDAENWQLIAEFLKGDNYTQIHPLNRAQLLDDALNLAKVNKLKYNQVLSLTAYLKQEVDYIPWYSAFNSFSYLHRVFASSSVYASLKEHILDLTQGLQKKLTWEESANDTHVEKLLRVDLLNWACTLGSKSCRDHASLKLSSWMNDSKIHKFSPDTRSPLLCAAVRSVDKATWNKLLEKHLNEDESDLLTALGCTSDAEILNGYLAKILDVNTTLDRDGVVNAVCIGSENGVNVALEFVIANKNKIIEYSGNTTDSIKKYITAIGSRITNAAQFDKLKKFIDDNADLKDVAAPGLESSQDNINWLKSHEQEFIDYFTKADPPTTPKPGSAFAFTVSSILFVASLLLSQLY